MLNDIEIKNLEDLCKENRLNVLKMVYNAQSGHLGGALSAVEIMTVLYNKVMKTCKNGAKVKILKTEIGLSYRKVTLLLSYIQFCHKLAI